MNILNFFVSDAHAMAPNSQQGGGGYEGIIMLVIMFAIFYFLLIRPQSKRAKAHRELIENLSLGDSVVTAGGIHGKVTAVQDDILTLPSSANRARKSSNQTVQIEPRFGSEIVL